LNSRTSSFRSAGIAGAACSSTAQCDNGLCVDGTWFVPSYHYDLWRRENKLTVFVFTLLSSSLRRLSPSPPPPHSAATPNSFNPLIRSRLPCINYHSAIRRNSQGGLTQGCGGVDSNCSGFLYCNSGNFQTTPSQTCGGEFTTLDFSALTFFTDSSLSLSLGLGSFCQDPTQSDTANPPEENYKIL